MNAQMLYMQSFPILTRLQASVIYLLARLFKQTSVYVVQSRPARSLLFTFEQFEPKHMNELKQTQSILSNENLLQFVHIHQLLGKNNRIRFVSRFFFEFISVDEHFVGNLFQGNNFYFQLEYIHTDLTT